VVDKLVKKQHIQFVLRQNAGVYTQFEYYPVLDEQMDVVILINNPDKCQPDCSNTSRTIC